MTTDRELLEMAAKAAGISGEHRIAPTSGTWIFIEPRTPNWNPLTDDGDALRLAVKLGIDLHFSGRDGHMATFVGAFAFTDFNNDPCAATRRAIVRAAAEIGLTLDKKP